MAITKPLCPPSYLNQLLHQQGIHLLLACSYPLSFICYRAIILAFSHGPTPSQELQSSSWASGPTQSHTPEVWRLDTAPEQVRDSISRHLLETLVVYSQGLSGAILENNLHKCEANTEENTSMAGRETNREEKEKEVASQQQLQVSESAVLEANPNSFTYSLYEEAELNF